MNALLKVALYMMMLSDRYEPGEIGPGLLWYLGDPEVQVDSQMVQVDAVHQETSALVRVRNTLVAHLAQNPVWLPPLMHDEPSCNKCFAQVPCALLHKVTTVVLSAI